MMSMIHEKAEQATRMAMTTCTTADAPATIETKLTFDLVEDEDDEEDDESSAGAAAGVAAAGAEAAVDVAGAA
jgi:hypothetical protein